MKISEIYKRKDVQYSIEVFPPKNGESLDNVLRTIEQLNGLKPSFVSVTFGALGNNRRGTIEIATRAKYQYEIEAMAHLTCAGKSKQELENLLVGAKYAGIENILALRGDPQKGENSIEKRSGEYKYAFELVDQIRQMNGGQYLDMKGEKTDFCIGVACYPEGHLENPDKNIEAKYLKIKQDAGAEFAITQMFFDNKKYFKFAEDAKRQGVTIPIIPGIMPIRKASSVQYFSKTFGVSIPKSLSEELQCEDAEKTGIEWAVRQCGELINHGVKGIHFYTMNEPRIVKKILSALQKDP